MLSSYVRLDPHQTWTKSNRLLCSYHFVGLLLATRSATTKRLLNSPWNIMRVGEWLEGVGMCKCMGGLQQPVGLSNKTMYTE